MPLLPPMLTLPVSGFAVGRVRSKTALLSRHFQELFWLRDGATHSKTGHGSRRAYDVAKRQFRALLSARRARGVHWFPCDCLNFVKATGAERGNQVPVRVAAVCRTGRPASQRYVPTRSVGTIICAFSVGEIPRKTSCPRSAWARTPGTLCVPSVRRLRTRCFTLPTALRGEGRVGGFKRLHLPESIGLTAVRTVQISHAN
jgi:hypothetical protein